MSAFIAASGAALAQAPGDSPVDGSRGCARHDGGEADAWSLGYVRKV